MRGIRTQLGSAQHGSHGLSVRCIRVGSITRMLSSYRCALEGAHFCINGPLYCNRDEIMIATCVWVDKTKGGKLVIEHLCRAIEFARKCLDELL